MIILNIEYRISHNFYIHLFYQPASRYVLICNRHRNGMMKGTWPDVQVRPNFFIVSGSFNFFLLDIFLVFLSVLKDKNLLYIFSLGRFS